MLAAAFEKTLMNPKEGERLIKGFEDMPEFISCLLSFIASPSMNLPTKHAVSIYFKNFIKAHWVPVEDSSGRIAEEVRNNVKANIIPTLFNCKEKTIQSQMVESIIIIAALEYPNDWPTLLDASNTMVLGPYHFKLFYFYRNS